MPETPGPQEFLDQIKAKIPDNLMDVCARFPGLCKDVDEIKAKVTPQSDDVNLGPTHSFGGHDTLQAAVDCPTCNAQVHYDQQALDYAKQQNLKADREWLEGASEEQAKAVLKRLGKWPPPGIAIPDEVLSRRKARQ